MSLHIQWGPKVWSYTENLGFWDSPKINKSCTLSHLHVVPNLNDFLSSAEHKRWSDMSDIYFNSFFHHWTQITFIVWQKKKRTSFVFYRGKSVTQVIFHCKLLDSGQWLLHLCLASFAASHVWHFILKCNAQVKEFNSSVFFPTLCTSCFSMPKHILCEWPMTQHLKNIMV